MIIKTEAVPKGRQPLFIKYTIISGLHQLPYQMDNFPIQSVALLA